MFAKKVEPQSAQSFFILDYVESTQSSQALCKSFYRRARKGFAVDYK
jgi:hypothetical protein